MFKNEKEKEKEKNFKYQVNFIFFSQMIQLY